MAEDAAVATAGRSLLALDGGLEIWRVPLDDLREQDKNARVMDPQAMERLEQTFKRDGRLENLPFCALTDRGVEVVSGHHRTRAARSSGMKEIFVLVDTTGLTRDQITAKQLAHNAIEGRDDPQLVKELYESIQDVDARLESFIDPSELDLDLENLSVGNVAVDFDHRIITVVFMPHELDRFKRACEAVLERIQSEGRGDVEEVLVASIEQAELFTELTKGISDAVEVKAYGPILSVMADIVLPALGVAENDLEKPDGRHISQVMKRAYIPADAAEIIAKALDRMEERGTITARNRWQGLEYLAADYLAGA
jgi:hypothetical protein